MTDIDQDREAGEAADPPAREAPPPDLLLRCDPPRVMRLSRKALAVMGTVAGVGIGGVLIFGLQPPFKRPAEELYNTDSRRSEEHTSELQSLMRISYAVFCLKKKIKTRTTHAEKP